jgi:exopolysaccharide biosynthesis polyprenyl glycosylphosphotransferase
VLAVEAEPIHITNQSSESAPLEVPTPSRSGVSRAPVHERRRNTPARLGLQRRAQFNFQRHFLRGFRRFVVLVIADLASFYVMRALVRAVREDAVLGQGVASRLHSLLPPGLLNGWQYAAALFVGLVILGNYGPGDERRNPKRLFLACALATALPLWMSIWSRGVEVVALQYVVTTLLVWLGLVTERQLLSSVIDRVRPRPEGRLSTLFVGPAEACRATQASPAFSGDSEYHPIGFVDTHIPPTAGALGHIVDFAAVLHDMSAEAVVVCGYLTDARFHDVVDAALTGGCKVLAVPRSIEIAGVVPHLVWRREQPLVELSAPTLRGGQLIVKRFVDVLGASIGLILATPLFLFVAALVKLDSPGPVFFRQNRVGRGGRLFKIFKFRTMVAGAEERRDELLEQSIYPDRRLFKIVRDPRVTKLGAWLRRTSLDELPQLFNVLKGEMSLVGPRPPIPSEVDLYEAHHYARFDVKPGITGPWQVAGRNRITDFEQIVALETRYIREWSLLGDIWMLGRTAVVVLRMQGAL